MHIALIDDNALDRQQIRKYLQDYAAANHTLISTDCFSCAADFLSDYHPLQYTVVFLDIFMEGMNGIDAAKELRRCDANTILVFLTSTMEYMPDAFSCHAFDYIQKPVVQKRIFQVMDDIQKKYARTAEYLSFRHNRRVCDLPYSDIVYASSSGHNINIRDCSGNLYSPRMSFDFLQNKLSQDERFLLINRGIFVNMDYVVNIENHTCQLEAEIVLPVKVRSSVAIEQQWKNYTFMQIRKESLEWRSEQ